MVVPFAAALMLVTRYRFRRAVARWQKELLSHSRVFYSSVGPVEFAVRGVGMPILVSHGSGGGYDQGLLLARTIGDGFRWISVSRFGYLRSGLPRDASSRAQATTYARLLDHLGIDRAGILGVSIGAPAALEFARSYPDRCTRLVLLSPIAGKLSSVSNLALSIDEAAWRWDFLSWILITAGRSLLPPLFGIPAVVYRRLSDEERIWLSQLVATHFPVSSRRAGLLNDRRIMRLDEGEDVAAIRAPVLILSAADDPFAPLDHTKEVLPALEARRIVLADGGHLLLGHHHTARRIVRPFLAG